MSRIASGRASLTFSRWGIICTLIALNPSAATLGATIKLVAVKVNDIPISLRSTIDVWPDTKVEVELRLTDFGTELPEGIRSVQAVIAGRFGAVSGSGGRILPYFWDAPLDLVTCTLTSDCPAGFSCSGGSCKGEVHFPSVGAPIDVNRPDFLLFGSDVLAFTATTTLDYVYNLVDRDVQGKLDDGSEFYLGTLILVVSENACGTFTFDGITSEAVAISSSLIAPDNVTAIIPSFIPLEVVIIGCDVPTCVSDADCDDSMFCNGVETCVSHCQAGTPPCMFDEVCDEASNTCLADCNHNGISDDLDIAAGISLAGCASLEAVDFGGFTTITDMTPDGSVIIGNLGPPFSSDSIRWTSDGGPVVIGGIFALAVSDDGNVVIGNSGGGQGCSGAFHWSTSGGLVALPDLPGGGIEGCTTCCAEFANAETITGDGMFVFGIGRNSGTNTVPARWINLQVDAFCAPVVDASRTGSILLTGDRLVSGMGCGTLNIFSPLPGGASILGTAISADGKIVVGQSESAQGMQAFEWDTGTTSGLGDLPGGAFESQALSLSMDGTFVVGWGTSVNGKEAMIWDSINGMRSLQNVLADSYGVDTEGWTLSEVVRVSSDGMILVGHGAGPGGEHAWIAELGDCNGNGVPDHLDAATGNDCNSNGVPDDCEIIDCNQNGVEDLAEVVSGTSPDCNTNGVPDECDVADGVSRDCNSNGIPDECDIDSQTSVDCNGNGVLDDCEEDCNCNNIDDAQDLSVGTSLDLNGNGVPDECDSPEPSTFFVGSIPDQSVWHDRTISFFVDAPSLSPGASITAVANPLPLGPVTLDATNLFSYQPDLNDKSAFTVTFTADDGIDSIAQNVLISPLPVLPAESIVFGFAPTQPVPDPEGKEYIVRNEVLSDTLVLFNTQCRTTRTINIAGKRLVFEAGHPNGLYESFNENDDIKSLTISAETVIIRSPFHLPQTDVTIYARELRFEDPPGNLGLARLDTTPRSLTIRPGQFQNGAHGHDAGNITLHAERFVIFPMTSCQSRFILDGGNGQPAGLGQNGTDGNSVPQVCCNFGGGSCSITVRCDVVEETFGGTLVFLATTDCGGGSCGQQLWPTSGQDAQAGGRPGNAGNGGQLSTSFGTAIAFLVATGGSGGSPAGFYEGGSPGTPPDAIWVTLHDPFTPPTVQSIPATPTHGAFVDSPFADVILGVNGKSIIVGHEFSWLTPASLCIVVAHARDAYIIGHSNFPENVISDYLDTLLAFQASSHWASVSATDQLEFFQLQDEITSILHRLGNNLDFFGNPAGWVPMLSFEVNRALFDQEVDRAIRVLYLSTWLGNAATDLQTKVTALATARQEFQDEINEFITEYNNANELIPALDVEANNITVRISDIRAELQVREQFLLAQAQANLRGPFWKKAFRVIGAALTVIPVGQPVLGGIGLGLDLITKINIDDPLSVLGQVEGVVKTFKDADFKKAASDWRSAAANLDFGNLRQTVKTLKELSQPIADGLKEVKAALRESQVSDERLKHELDRLKAEDPLFNDLVDQTTELLVQKKLFGEKLAALMQSISTLSNDITQNLLAIDAMNRDISEGNAALDERVCQHLDLMERRARNRLIKYHYFMRKAFEYRMLQPLNSSLDLTTMLDQMIILAQATNSTETLDPTQFGALKELYEEQLATITEQIFTLFNANAPARATDVRFSLLPEELDVLNAGEPLVINLQDRGLFFSDEEDVRMVDIGVLNEPDGIVTSFVGPVPQSFATLDIDFLHGGESRIEKGGEAFKFRHFTGTTVNPLVWSSRFDAIDQTVSQQPVSLADQSLLLSLLSFSGIPTVDPDNVLLFSRPGGDADLLLTKAVNTDNGSDILIDSLRIRADFDFRTRPSFLKSLDIEASDPDIVPLVTLDTMDENNRQDGRGSFRRIYLGGQAVTVSAEPRFGKLVFDRWTDGFGNDLVPSATGPTLQIQMDTDVSRIATYIRVLGDFDGDGNVNLIDFAQMPLCATGPLTPVAPGCDSFDFDDSGTVDLIDFAGFQRVFSADQ